MAVNKMLTIMERQPLNYYAFFKGTLDSRYKFFRRTMKPPGKVVVKFRRIREPPYKVLVGIVEHGGSLE